MSFAAALFMGSCSGHGTGSGSTHHPGLGGSIMKGCTIPANTDVKTKPKTVTLMNGTTSWLPTPQTPTVETVRTVRINQLSPILDQDLLIPHPTTTMHAVNYTGKPKVCPPGSIPNNAWWLTKGAVAGREAPTGHPRKLFATCKTVFILGKRAGRFGDPFGDLSLEFPCTSTVAGSSKDVFIGTIKG
tara:strand:+ start:1859 stop:2419 length:561 start_codon:yes stop_codon:yes gene_type:complete